MRASRCSAPLPKSWSGSTSAQAARITQLWSVDVISKLPAAASDHSVGSITQTRYANRMTLTKSTLHRVISRACPLDGGARSPGRGGDREERRGQGARAERGRRRRRTGAARRAIGGAPPPRAGAPSGRRRGLRPADGDPYPSLLADFQARSVVAHSAEAPGTRTLTPCRRSPPRVRAAVRSRRHRPSRCSSSSCSCPGWAGS